MGAIQQNHQNGIQANEANRQKAIEMTLEEREKWDERYQSQQSGPTIPHSALDRIARWLPEGGRLLDAGGGTGRNAIWAAKQGFEVTLADISRFGLELAKDNINSAGLCIDRWCIDLDSATPARRWDVILCVNFLLPKLIANLDQWLVDDGVFVMLHPTLENLTRHSKPSRRYLISPAEIVASLPVHELLHFDADWRDDGRHEMELVCRLRTK